MQAYNRSVSRVSSMSSPQLLDMKWPWHGSASSGTPDGSSHSKTHAAVPAPQQVPDRGLRLIVVGWQESGVPDLLLQLQGLAPRGSRIMSCCVGRVRAKPSLSQATTDCLMLASSSHKHSQAHQNFGPRFCWGQSCLWCELQSPAACRPCMMQGLLLQTL